MESQDFGFDVYPDVETGRMPDEIEQKVTGMQANLTRLLKMQFGGKFIKISKCAEGDLPSSQ